MCWCNSQLNWSLIKSQILVAGLLRATSTERRVHLVQIKNDTHFYDIHSTRCPLIKPPTPSGFCSGMFVTSTFRNNILILCRSWRTSVVETTAGLFPVNVFLYWFTETVQKRRRKKRLFKCLSIRKWSKIIHILLSLTESSDSCWRRAVVSFCWLKTRLSWRTAVTQQLS